MEEEQEILQWESYEKAMQIVRAEETVQTEEIVQSLSALKKTIEEGRRAIQRYEEAAQRYDEIAAQMERLRAEKNRKKNRSWNRHGNLSRKVWITGSQKSLKKKKRQKSGNRIIPFLQQQNRKSEITRPSKMPVKYRNCCEMIMNARDSIC